MKIDKDTKELLKIITDLLACAPIVECADFHHTPQDYHKFESPCPVERKWYDTVDKAQDLLRKYYND